MSKESASPLETLRSIIKEKEVTQAYVAEQAGMTPKQLSDLLNGEMVFDVYYVTPICNALEITPNKLFGVSELDYLVECIKKRRGDSLSRFI